MEANDSANVKKIKMCSKPKLYYIKESPPCQTVIAVARLLAIDLELIDVSETYQSPQYAKVNPFNRVPTFVDTDGFKMFESRAIAMYLIQSRAPDSPLYPAGDLQQRAEIDQHLHFELGTLYRGLSDVIDPFWKSGEIDRSRKPSLERALQWLDVLLASNNRPFIAGHRLTLADLSAYFYLRILAAFPAEIDCSVYRAVAGWQRTVAEELRPITAADGFFEGALTSLKEYCALMRQGVRQF